MVSYKGFEQPTGISVHAAQRFEKPFNSTGVLLLLPRKMTSIPTLVNLVRLATPLTNTGLPCHRTRRSMNLSCRAWPRPASSPPLFLSFCRLCGGSGVAKRRARTSGTCKGRLPRCMGRLTSIFGNSVDNVSHEKYCVFCTCWRFVSGTFAG